ncbi:hypothetical protein BH23PLA1_BH23PLA1_19590 [soil metagenome]
MNFRDRGYWWICLSALVVLSLGAYWTIDAYQIPLPTYWIRKHLLIFNPIRFPGRFNLFASVIAAAGLRHLLARLPSQGWRSAACVGLGVVALADLAWVPFRTIEIPPEPTCYKVLAEANPGATLFEAPHYNGICFQAAASTYWQSRHRLRTSAGYTANFDRGHEDLLTFNSPFYAYRLSDPDYLSNPEAESFDLIEDADPRGYIWIYLREHYFDYLIVHRTAGSIPGTEIPVHLDRIEALLEEARIQDDEEAAVYCRERLRPPTRPVVLCTEGWRHGLIFEGRRVRLTPRTARLTLFNPSEDRALSLTFKASTFQIPRTVRLLSGEKELARWQMSPGGLREYSSPPIRLPAGVQELMLESDGEGWLPRSEPEVLSGDTGPFSLFVASIRLADDASPSRLARDDR